MALELKDKKGRQLTVYQPAGAGGYHVLLDNMYHGQIVHCLYNGWRAVPNNDSLSKAYWDKLVEWVKEYEQNK
jgi:hypothetical protein